MIMGCLAVEVRNDWEERESCMLMLFLGRINLGREYRIFSREEGEDLRFGSCELRPVTAASEECLPLASNRLCASPCFNKALAVRQRCSVLAGLGGHDLCRIPSAFITRKGWFEKHQQVTTCAFAIISAIASIFSHIASLAVGFQNFWRSGGVVVRVISGYLSTVVQTLVTCKFLFFWHPRA
ncbi:hypothetical protein ACE6H2_028276 [Prunus campanulata]